MYFTPENIKEYKNPACRDTCLLCTELNLLCIFYINLVSNKWSDGYTSRTNIQEFDFGNKNDHFYLELF
jgi:hypothetical protein